MASKKRPSIKPMTHQGVSLKHAAKTDRVFDTSDPGTGKTGVAVWDFDRRRARKGGKLMVFAPRSLLRSAWEADFRKFAPGLKVSCAFADNRAAAFAVDADVYVVNHDGVKWVAQQKKAFFKDFEMLVVDESTAFKHHSSQRSRALAKIAKHFKIRRLLTATPNGRSITDVWHQVYLLDDGRRLGPSFFAFRNQVCEPEQRGRNQNAIEWIDKEGAEEAVFGLLQDIVIRHKFEDCVDIPPMHEYAVEFEMSPKMRKAYDTLERTQILPLLNAGKMNAVNAAIVANKLLQICSGAVYDNDGEAHLVDDARYELALDLVEARIRQHPLVFFYWQHQRDALVQSAEKRGLRFAVIDGGTSDAERHEIMLRYQSGQYDTVFGHPKSVAHGLTFTTGQSIIWTGPTTDAEWYKQGSRRQYRIGQKDKTENVMVLAKDTREQRCYDILLGRKARMGALLGLFEGIEHDT